MGRASRGAEQFALLGDADARPGADESAHFVQAMVSIDDDARHSRGREPFENVGQHRTVAHRDERLRAVFRQREEPRSQARSEDHRGDHLDNLALLVASCVFPS